MTVPVLWLLLAVCGTLRMPSALIVAVMGAAAYGAGTAALLSNPSLGLPKALIALFWAGLACLIGYLVKRRRTGPTMQ